MKQKTRKMSIRMKVLIPASLLMLSVSVALGITAYKSLERGMVAMGVEQARITAESALDIIDGDVIEKLEPGCEDTKIYQETLASMREVQQKYGIAYLYTLYTDGTNVYYGIDTDSSEEQLMVGDLFEFSYDELADCFAGKEYVQDYIDVTEYGNLITAYLPITNSEGEVVAILGCDYDGTTVMGQIETAIKTIVVLAIFYNVLAMVVLNIVIVKIMKSLKMVDQKIYDLVNSEGDLTQKLDVQTGDEMELIAENVNKLLEYIRGIMLNIAGNSMQLNNSSQAVVKNLSSAEENITDVSATMEEMSASMEETSASLNQISGAIGMVYEAIETISVNANEGKASSEEIMRKAAGIYEKAVQDQKDAKLLAQDMADIVNDRIEKSQSVEEISALTSTIIGITEQTNLLALNASIEAARAGEAGRGFAVVADEIGKLASNSAETATQIQRVSTQVVGAVNELAAKAEEMLTFLDETAMNGYEKLLETSKNYQSDVHDLSQKMQEFADESGQIKRSIDEIKASISTVGIAVEESAKGVSNVTEMSVDITTSVSDIENEANSNMSIANLLNSEVSKFKLE